MYDADGTTSGELRYWFSARFGRSHCSLCEITHGAFREKPEWRSARDSLAIEFTTFHRNDAPVDVIAASSGEFPVVVARTTSEITVVLNAKELESLNGDSKRFVATLEAACVRMGLGSILLSEGS
ncbi:MAG: hypothetical protein NT081_02670 [Actinobacteria bacterium]|nr:hypothetical protein [Actinomycetota bacterium]